MEVHSVTPTPSEVVDVRDTHVSEVDKNKSLECIETTHTTMSNGTSNNISSTNKQQKLTGE